jgi:rRNA maturation RNase YbeY
MAIHFFSEDIEFKIFKPQAVRKWLKTIASQENFVIANINYIFCSDAYLLEINKQYLDHDYYTDIITFDQSETETSIEGDIYISIERVRENALIQNIDFHQELMRVTAHGLLHLIGYLDKNESDIITMRSKEDYCLFLWNKQTS